MTQPLHTVKPDMPDPAAPATATVAVLRRAQGVRSAVSDQVALEVPVALVFNGISHAVMLATPIDLRDFAIGFSFCEGIIDQRAEIYDIEQIDHPGVGIEMHLTISNACFARLKAHRRSLIGRTGCGLCGLESLTAFESGLAIAGDGPGRNFMITRTALSGAFNALQCAQPVNALTGSMHAAAWVNASGEVLAVREDLGRHNALDKLIGALLGQDMTAGCILMTSRASYELAQKAARAQVPLLATISGPTSLAIEVAEKNGLTLAGFVRNGGMVVYCHPERIDCD